ncbi:MAG: hypothetical protein H7346_18170 [Burkholderiaceae bacterium]|nr:hypothetical protein [Burkholderiaceae bacterium]
MLRIELDKLNVPGQRHWKVQEDSGSGVGLPGRCIFAQNDSYLEMCNPGWKEQYMGVMGLLLIVPFGLFIIWIWYGLAVHPLWSGNVMFFVPWQTIPFDSFYVWAGWLFLFPFAAASAFMIFAAFCYMGNRTLFFTDLRGRIRFNRLTRKVYVLRPGYCGGNKVFDWDRLVALCDLSGPRRTLKVLALYHPPFDANDQPVKGPAKGEDCIFVGNVLPSYEAARPLWEYIRRYMQEGPTVDRIPHNATEHFNKVARYVPQEYTTYCGKPDGQQYRLEVRPGLGGTFLHMLSQMTCDWAKFPKEWQSDSGLGEPEDRPVQTGAVMTALAYRARGRLSLEDEVEFLTHWGTKEALAEARLAQAQRARRAA